MKKFIFLFLLISIGSHCRNNPASNKKITFTVSEAPEWDKIFVRNNGWFGGDGIFSVSLDGKENPGSKSTIYLWFSDSMFGNIENDSLQPDFSMINNSFAVMSENEPDSIWIHFYPTYQPPTKPNSIFIPSTPQSRKDEYYWLGDGFINQAKNNDLYIFAYRITNHGSGDFAFKQTGNNLLVIPSGTHPPFNNHRQLDIPFFNDENKNSSDFLGAGILVNTKPAGVAGGDGFIYIYGIKGQNKELIVARTLPEEIEDFSKWTFWESKKFSSDYNELHPVAENISHEMSVSAYSVGKYIMVYQRGLNGKIFYQLGNTPYGPFDAPVEIYDPAKNFVHSKKIFTYNAKAHPVLSQPGELLISYNVNSYDFFNEIKTSSHLYRPRFIILKYH